MTYFLEKWRRTSRFFMMYKLQSTNTPRAAPTTGVIVEVAPSGFGGVGGGGTGGTGDGVGNGVGGVGGGVGGTGVGTGVGAGVGGTH